MTEQEAVMRVGQIFGPLADAVDIQTFDGWRGIVVTNSINKLDRPLSIAISLSGFVNGDSPWHVESQREYFRDFLTSQGAL